MTDEELAFVSARELARLIRRKLVSPVEVTRAALRRIETLNRRLHAFITVSAEHALGEARAAEAALRHGRGLGRLHGVPVAVKDLYLTRGIRTTAGSKLFAEWLPDEDATVVTRLRAAGAVLLGKLNMHELAFGPEGTNAHYGTPPNPWDPSRLPGGSSSGSAVALATGLAALTLGSDTGGSIRVPASLCGVVGLKPTFGRVSRHGLIPLAPSLDHVGPLARSVADAALCLGVIAGFDPQDPSSSRTRVPSYLHALRPDLGKIRLGVPRDSFFERLDPDVARLLDTAITQMKKLGARTRSIRLPTFEAGGAAALTIISAEAMAWHESSLRTRGTQYGPEVRERLLAGERVLALDYVKAQALRETLAKEFNEAFGQVDLVVTPTEPVPAPRIGVEAVEVKGVAEPVRSALTRLTRPVNLVGLPALSLPCGFTSSGLPVGMQLIGRFFDEATVLSVGHAYEQTTDWHRRRPPLARLGEP